MSVSNRRQHDCVFKSLLRPMFDETQSSALFDQWPMGSPHKDVFPSQSIINAGAFPCIRRKYVFTNPCSIVSECYVGESTQVYTYCLRELGVILVHCRSILQRVYELFCMTIIRRIMIGSGHNFEHVTTAELSWHAQKCGLIKWQKQN